MLSLEQFSPDGWDDADDVIDLLFTAGMREVSEDDADVVAQSIVTAHQSGQLPDPHTGDPLEDQPTPPVDSGAVGSQG